jgi:LysR family glycine cleavage system transcriptional activator
MADALRLLPLNALRVFHYVSRYGSLRRAAEELRVSPQAISQQIAQLEKSLGTRLIERNGRGIRMTRTAVMLAAHVEAGFAELSEGVRRLSDEAARVRVALNASPYFAARYLMPRLARLRHDMKGIELSLTTIIAPPDLLQEGLDLSIDWGFDDEVSPGRTLLLRDPKVICCTPAIAGGIHGPADLLRFDRLHTQRGARLWPGVLAYLSVPLDEVDRPLTFGDAATMRRATLQGEGIGLLSRADAEEEIRAGTLVAPLGLDALQGLPEAQVPGFYLSLPRAHARVPQIARLVRWMRAQDWRATVAADLPDY